MTDEEFDELFEEITEEDFNHLIASGKYDYGLYDEIPDYPITEDYIYQEDEDRE